MAVSVGLWVRLVERNAVAWWLLWGGLRRALVSVVMMGMASRVVERMVLMARWWWLSSGHRWEIIPVARIRHASVGTYERGEG
ncbi:hypothetical protein Tco_0608728 [Tanacetum coccineum]